MRQLVYTMFISNNRAWFLHLWRKENLLKRQTVSKYYENNCSIQVFILIYSDLFEQQIIVYIEVKIFFLPRSVL